jgi:hypothetical protein
MTFHPTFFPLSISNDFVKKFLFKFLFHVINYLRLYRLPQEFFMAKENTCTCFAQNNLFVILGKWGFPVGAFKIRAKNRTLKSMLLSFFSQFNSVLRTRTV